MDFRRNSLVHDREQKATPNSIIYSSFAGGGVNCDPSTMWWDEQRIEATVTRQFVLSHLRPDEQVRLFEKVSFGDGLTDDTYMEWIELKAKRIFLILVDLGVPDQIFGVIDDSWDDDDLPVPWDQVERLRLTYNKDEKVERKFFLRQFYYLLRNIQQGEHLSYDNDEVVPLEAVDKRPLGAVAGLTQTNIDKVYLPGKSDNLLLRRRIPLGTTPGRMPQEEFLSGVETMKGIWHSHITSLWASYIHQDNGYLLLTPVSDSTLKSFLVAMPQSLKIMPKQDRRSLMLNWIHCLCSAISFLHARGLSHGNIRPSTIMLDEDNHIFWSDTGAFSSSSSLTGEKPGFDKESYDYSAPEQKSRPPAPPQISLPVTRPNIRRPSEITSSASSSGYSGSDTSSLSPYSTWQRHDPQLSDIFSLGTIILEILTIFLKRTSRSFSSHRSARNKTAGRGGGLPDSSFHSNISQVEIWIGMLAKDASKKEDRIFRGVGRILLVVKEMIRLEPRERPSAKEVEERVRGIMVEFCDGEEKLHCLSHANAVQTEWEFGFEDLRIASQRVAAEACANVNPRTVTANGGKLGVFYRDERPQSCVSSTSPSTGLRSQGRFNSVAASSRKGKERERDGDSMRTKKSSSSGDGKSRSGGSGTVQHGGGRTKAKPKAWQAPVYAELNWG